MGKSKMKFPSLLKGTTQQKPNHKPSSSWPSWPSCHQPKTLSFRAQNDTAFKTFNAAFSDSDATIDTVSRSLRSDRFFFEPNQTSSSILEAKSGERERERERETPSLPFKDTVVLSLESQDPYLDFRTSMEEMLAAKCVHDWEGLQDLLCWYLKVNGKSNHAYILGAFVDLLVASSSSSSSSTTTTTSSSVNNHCSPSSPLSFYSSSSCSTRCVSCLEADEDEVIDNDITTITAPTSSLLLEQVREHEASSSSSSSSSN